MKVKEESEKVSLKLNIQKTKIIMASGPITSWQEPGALRAELCLGGQGTAEGALLLPFASL